MIIGNNFNKNPNNNTAKLPTSSFEQKFKAIQDANQYSKDKRRIFDTEYTGNRHANVMDRKEMKDRSFDILKDRLDKGLITTEEFNRKINQINKNSN